MSVLQMVCDPHVGKAVVTEEGQVEHYSFNEEKN